MAGPSLSPRGPLQKWGVVAAAVLGAGAGAGVEAVSRGVDRALPGDLLDAQLLTGGAGAALAAGIAIAARGRATGARAALQSGGIVVAAGGGAGVASSLLARADAQLPGPDSLAQGTLAVAAGATLLGVAMRDAGAARAMSRTLPDLPELAVDAAATGRLAIDRGRGVRGALAAGGEQSLLSWQLQPGQGKRFLTEMPHAEDIGRVMGVDASEVAEPIRAYVGLRHVPSELDDAAAIQARARLAVQELDRLGAFGRVQRRADGSVRVLEQPRRSILVAAPTASGFVNPVATSSHEFLFLGDTATVAVEVGKRKTPGELSRSAATHQALLEQVAERIGQLPDGVRRPELRVYGESFGAWTSQRGMLDGADDGAAVLRRLDELGVAQAYYVGTPGLSTARPLLLADEALAGGDEPLVRMVHDMPHARATMRAGDPVSRVTFLQHEADAVALVHPSIAWERPAWLGPEATRPPGVPARQRWAPGLTAVQTAIDQQMAQQFRQGVLEAKGHDYRLELSYVMRRAFGAGDVGDQQVARIREWNRQLEEIHAVHQAQARAERAAAAATAS